MARIVELTEQRDKLELFLSSVFDELILVRNASGDMEALQDVIDDIGRKLGKETG